MVRLRASGRRDTTFGNNGITYPLLGRPPGGDPIYTSLDAIDANGARAIIAGSAAGPGAARSAAAPRARSTPAASRSPSRD